MKPTYEDVLKAESMRGKEIRKTPLVHSPTFSQLIGSEVYLKMEHQQKTGAFKIRGAYYKINHYQMMKRKTVLLLHQLETMHKE